MERTTYDYRLHKFMKDINQTIKVIIMKDQNQKKKKTNERMKNIWEWNPLVDYLEANFFYQETEDAEVDVKLQKKNKLCKIKHNNL